MKERLSGWKANLISQAGRVVLINSVLNTIPSHIMQCTYLPQSTCRALYRINHNFLWGSSAQHRRMHMVAWDTVTKLIGEGGLGNLWSREKNLALLGNLACRGNTVNRPWARLLREKYKTSTRHVRGCPLNGRALQEEAKIATKGIKWAVGFGQNIKFWHDVWVRDQPLREIVEGHLSVVEIPGRRATNGIGFGKHLCIHASQCFFGWPVIKKSGLITSRVEGAWISVQHAPNVKAGSKMGHMP